MNLLISTIFIISLYITQALSQDSPTSASKVTLDGALLRSQADALTSAFPSATPFTKPFEIPGGNLIQPPSAVVGAIITGIPPSVLAQLIQPAGRESIASEFRAGNTPDWYVGLPADVKGYVTSMRAQVSHGDVDLSATPTNTGGFGSGEGSGGDDGESDQGSNEGDADNDDGETGKETGGGAATTTSSTAAGVPRATGEVFGSLVGVMGVLGAVAFL